MPPSLDQDDFHEHLQPGHAIKLWVREDGDVSVYGKDGDYIYQGYQVIGTVTFLIVDYVHGSGKKATVVSRLAFNASEVEKFLVVPKDL